MAGTFGFDAYAYWSVDPAAPYGVPWGSLGAFSYSPVIARLCAPFAAGAVLAVRWLWTAILVGTAIWLGGRPVRPILSVFAFPPVALELYHGNIHLLLAAAIALGFRYPWTLVVRAAHEGDPGRGAGLVRRAPRVETRCSSRSGVTGVVVAVSLLLDPAAWR